MVKKRSSNICCNIGIPRWHSGTKNLPAHAGNTSDTGVTPESGRSPGGGNGNLFQYSCLENSMTEEPGRLQSMGSQGPRHD